MSRGKLAGRTTGEEERAMKKVIVLVTGQANRRVQWREMELALALR